MSARAALAVVLAIGLCGASAAFAQPDGPPGSPDGRARFSFANPSGIIAAELAQARILRENGAKGLKEALKYYIADDAVIFAPDAINPRAYVKKAGALPISTQRSPYGVWMSCDGSQAIVQGAWQRDSATGYFVSVWERQEKGDYKWVLTREEAATPAAEAPEMLTARVARCRPKKAGDKGQGGPDRKDGRKGQPQLPEKKPGIARDETLRWQWRQDAAGNPLFVAEMWTGSGFEEVLKQSFPPPAAKIS